ncbi:Uncharacterised protein [Halioglobus japonicus]|nr:Uncharacterised protein [Halioglobus japonicus]
MPENIIQLEMISALVKLVGKVAAIHPSAEHTNV